MRNSNKQELVMTSFAIKFNNQQSPFDHLRKSQSYVSPTYQNSKSQKETLPPINSPILKKTIDSLITHKNSLLKDLKPYQLENKSSLTRNIQERTLIKLNQRFHNIESLGVQKLPKSHSQKKHDIWSKLQHQKKLLKGRTTMINNHERSTTQLLDQDESTSQHLFKKLLRISEKERQMNKKLEQRSEKRLVKETKPSAFIMMQKLNKELYTQEKEQIKLVRGLIKNSSNDNLNGAIKVKNYSKFMPTVISINN